MKKKKGWKFYSEMRWQGGGGIIQNEILSTYTSVYKQGEGKEPEPPSQICLGFRSTTLKLGRAAENPHGFTHHLHPEIWPAMS